MSYPIVVIKAERIVVQLSDDLAQQQFIAFDYDKQSKRDLEAVRGQTVAINLEDRRTGSYVSSMAVRVDFVEDPNEGTFGWDDVLIVKCTIVR